MQTKNKKVIYIIAFILFIAAGMVYKFVFKGNYDGITVLTASSVTDTVRMTSVSSSVTSESQSVMIKVYICGEVNNPGIYDVKAGSLLNDVAKIAGGFTDRAALNHLNLVYVFNSNMSVFIPNEDNLEEGDSVIMRNYQGSDTATGSLTSKVNINTASKEQLINLPGIGESTAMSIIAYRKDHSFDTIEDIMKVSGIGEAKFGRIKDMICV